MCKCTTVFIHSLVERNLCGFQFLVMMNETAMNIGEKMSLWWDEEILCYMCRSGTAGFWCRYIPIFLWSAYWLPMWLFKFTLPPAMEEWYHYSTSLPAWAVPWVFDFSHFNSPKMESQSQFDCISLIAKDIEHFLKCLLVIRDSHVENSLFRYVPHYLTVLFGLLILHLLCIFIYFGY